jgi:hypothetical protein
LNVSRVFVKEWRDEAIVRLRDAIRDPVTVSDAVDSLIAATVAKINENLRSEMVQIRALVHASSGETAYAAVRRLMTERNGLAAKYRDSQARHKEIIMSLKSRIKILERELENRQVRGVSP